MDFVLTCGVFRKIIFSLLGILIVIYCVGFWLQWEWIILIIPLFIILLTLMVGCFLGHCVIKEEWFIFLFWDNKTFKWYVVIVLVGILIAQGVDLLFFKDTYFFELMFWFFWIVFFFDVGCFVGNNLLVKWFLFFILMDSVVVSWDTYLWLWSLLVDEDECFDDLIVRLLDCKEWLFLDGVMVLVVSFYIFLKINHKVYIV